MTQLTDEIMALADAYANAVPANGHGDFEWGSWRKAKWSDMYLYRNGGATC